MAYLCTLCSMATVPLRTWLWQKYEWKVTHNSFVFKQGSSCGGMTLKLNHNLFWNLIKYFLDQKLLAVSKPESVFLAPKPNWVVSVHKSKLGLDVKFKSEAKIKNCEQNKGPHWTRSRIFLLLTHEMRAPTSLEGCDLSSCSNGLTMSCGI